MNGNTQDVWVFHGTGGTFASGVFSNLLFAEEWIANNKLSGVLTLYPLDCGVYDWSIQNGFFKIKREDQTTAEFIQKFSSASQDHYHYENGRRDGFSA